MFMVLLFYFTVYYLYLLYFLFHLFCCVCYLLWQITRDFVSISGESKQLHTLLDSKESEWQRVVRKLGPRHASMLGVYNRLLVMGEYGGYVRELDNQSLIVLLVGLLKREFLCYIILIIGE